MKKLILFFVAVLISSMSIAAKKTVLVTAGDNASYMLGGALTVTGLSIPELGINGEITLLVYDWDGVGGLAAGYNAIVNHLGEEIASCPDGLAITKAADSTLTIQGTMLGWPNDLQIDVKVAPKKASVIRLVSNEMEVAPNLQEPRDLDLSVITSGYAVNVILFNGMIKSFTTYPADSVLITINGESAALLDNTVATYSAVEDKVQFEASCVLGIDTFFVLFTGFPYAKPEDIIPIDTASLSFSNATLQYNMGMNRIEATSTNPQAHLFIGYTGAMYAKINASKLSYNTLLTLEGQDITFLRGEMQVVKNGGNSFITAAFLGNNRVWYNIQIAVPALSTKLDLTDAVSSPKKMMENGQLVIIENGVKYNVYGGIIK